MKPWLVFDRETAEASRAHSDRVEQTDQTFAQALEDSIQAGRTAVVVVRADGARATVARITPPQAHND